VPGKKISQQVLNGTILEVYEDSLDPGFIYYCRAAISKDTKADNEVWTIWRLFTTNGQITCPYDSDLGAPRPDGWKCSERESLGYWNDFPLDPPPEGFQYIIDVNGQYLKDLETKQFLIEAI